MSLIEHIKHRGVEGFRVGRFKFGTYTTSVFYRVGTTLIDTGPPNQWSVVRQCLPGIAPKRVLLTHHHEDHSGNAAQLQEAFAAAVLAPPDGISPLAEGFPLHLYQRIVWGRPPTMQAEPVPDEFDIGNGSRLRALHTPGHSTDMTSYLDPDRGRLFSGDLFITKRPRYFRADEDLEATIESLRHVLRYDFEIVFCAHRGVVTKGPQAIRDKLDYLLSLRERARALRQEGRTLDEITRALLGREELISWITLHDFSKRNLVEACLRSGRDKVAAVEARR